MNCAECDAVIAQKHIIYEDATTVARVVEHPAAIGQINVYPKEHTPIIEKLSDELFADMFVVANKVAIAAFELIGAHGTNIIINNGLAAGQKSSHTQTIVLPRFEDDGLQLQWQPTKAAEEDLNSMAAAIAGELEKKPEAPKEEVKEEKKEEPKEEIPESENYMLRQLDRMP